MEQIKKLAIELDGSQHLTTRKYYDKQRTLTLNQLGIRVIRFYDNEVMCRPDFPASPVDGLAMTIFGVVL